MVNDWVLLERRKGEKEKRRREMGNGRVKIRQAGEDKMAGGTGGLD